MNEELYLAGPFFNDEQVKLMDSIEKACTDFGIRYYSPRCRCLCPPEAEAWQRREVIRKNHQAIRTSPFVLACMDFLLPKDMALYACHSLPSFAEGGNAYPHKPVPRSGPLSIPDVGTLWECGYAAASGVPIVGFYLHPPKKLNLMLSETMTRVYGLENLRDLLGCCRAHGMNRGITACKAVLHSWEGKIV